MPAGRPGRGLVPGKLHFLAALPRVDGDPDADRSATASRTSSSGSPRRGAARPGPSCGCCPSGSTLDRRCAGRPARRRAAGCCSASTRRSSRPVGLDPDAEPHLLIFGDGQSGKSALLRAYVREVMRTRTPEEAQLVVVDYRRSLLGEVPDDYLLNYLTSRDPGAARDRRPGAATSSTRIPGPDVTPEQLRNRSWWNGAEVFVVVDDYDLVATAAGSPVAPLQPLLAQARDVGLHLVVARRSAAPRRALYEPVIQSLRDLAMPGLLLSGQPRRGPADRHHEAAARRWPGAAGSSPATAASRSSRRPGRSRRSSLPSRAAAAGRHVTGRNLPGAPALEAITHRRGACLRSKDAHRWPDAPLSPRP